MYPQELTGIFAVAFILAIVLAWMLRLIFPKKKIQIDRREWVLTDGRDYIAIIEECGFHWTTENIGAAIRFTNYEAIDELQRCGSSWYAIKAGA
ncbi:MAG: hypothetical protein ACXWJD_12680 [Burkholderiaceae bacterium]